MKARVLEGYLRQKSESGLRRIIILTGSRQAGKTALANQCLPAYAALSPENPPERGGYAKLAAAQWKGRTRRRAGFRRNLPS
jgi:hypothetical protein